jgi:hypothetical protein
MEAPQQAVSTQKTMISNIQQKEGGYKADNVHKKRSIPFVYTIYTAIPSFMRCPTEEHFERLLCVRQKQKVAALIISQASHGG